ncbi:MAG: hypothetical protein ACE5G8_01140 [Anaerolineae bacterium]
MKNPWIAAVLNFFFMGPGTVYNGRRKLFGIGLTIGALALTWLEFQLKVAAPNLYPVMFAAVFFVNLFFAYDGYTEAKTINRMAQ